MLSFRDKAWLKLKSCEFRLRGKAQLGAHTLLPGLSPYLPEDDELESIFIHIPKTAGTSLRLALYRRNSFHIPAVRYKISDDNRFQKYFKFTFVRNPWDRVHSAFNYLTRKKKTDYSLLAHRWIDEYLRDISSFERFVERLSEPRFRSNILDWIHFRPQIEWVSIPSRKRDRRIVVDYIGRYETLAADYEALSSKLGGLSELPISRKMPQQDFRKNYKTNRMIDTIADIYSCDIESFGYQFE